MPRIERILRAVESVPWALKPEKLAVIAEVLIAKAEAGAFPTAEDVQAIEARQRDRVVTTGESKAVAVLPLYGTISRRMGMLDAMSGGSSVETFSKNFARLVNDDSISAIVIDVDSPGGSVYGIDELAKQIYDARSKKKIVAVADQLMASAAYYVGSAASELVVSPSGEVGSIGVYTIHFDWSEHLKSAGIKATIIKAGERKAEGNPYEELGDEAEAHLQSLVDDYYGQFIRAVARNRGVSAKKVEAEFGQGLTFTAKRALERGMVDRVATLDQVIAELTSSPPSKAGRRAEATALPELEAIRETATPWAAAAAVAVGDAFAGRSPGEVLDVTTAAIGQALSHYWASDDESESDVVEQPSDTDAAAGHAADDDTTAPPQPAPAATEESMSGTDDAAQGPGAQGPSTEAVIAAERERVRQIQGIGEVHGIEIASVNKWIADGLTVEQVNAAVLEELKARQTLSTSVQVGADREAEQPFGTFGEQLIAIAGAEKNPAATDKRLLHLNAQYDRQAVIYGAASGANTAAPSEGGFVVQSDFNEGIVTKVWEDGKVLSRTNRVPISANSNALVRNHLKENSRADGSRYGGVRVYRAAQAATVTASKQEVKPQRIELEKLMGIFYATDELLQDAMALTVEAERGFRSELTFVSENEVFRGTGAGQMLGFLRSSALVSIAKESAQAAATILTANVAKMMARLPASSFSTAVWFIHTSCIPQLVTMTVGNQPVFLPGGSLAGAGFGTLFGIPIEPVEYCATLGTQGDIALVDLGQFTTVDKRAANWQESIHVRFLQDESTFKLTYRINGQPDWEDSVTPFQGTDKISPFIVLDVRA